MVAICGWVLFDLPTLGAAFRYYGAMFGFGGAGFCSAADLHYLKSNAVLLIAGVIACLPLGKSIYWRLSEKTRAWLSPALILAVLVLATAYLVDASYNPFLYFRF